MYKLIGILLILISLLLQSMGLMLLQGDGSDMDMLPAIVAPTQTPALAAVVTPAPTIAIEPWENPTSSGSGASHTRHGSETQDDDSWSYVEPVRPATEPLRPTAIPENEPTGTPDKDRDEEDTLPEVRIDDAGSSQSESYEDNTDEDTLPEIPVY